LYFSFLN
jgi:malate dehydrogenase